MFYISMAQERAVVKNQQGIHCRPSAVIVKALKSYEGSISVNTEQGQCDPRSIMALLSLGLQKGSAVEVNVDGPDADKTCRLVVELFETEFDFPPTEATASTS